MSGSSDDTRGQTVTRRGHDADAQSDEDGWAEAGGTRRAITEGMPPTFDDEWSAGSASTSAAKPASASASKPASAATPAAASAAPAGPSATTPGATGPTTTAARPRPPRASGSSSRAPASRPPNTPPPESPGSGSSPPAAPPMRRRGGVILLLVAGFVITVFAVWFIGQRNARDYFIHCGDSEVTATRGRAFPPWGEQRMRGDKWQPVANLLESNLCDETSVRTVAELQSRFRDIVVGQADSWLERAEQSDDRGALDTVRAQLMQARALSRGNDDASAAVRAHIDRLLGDVGYWQAYARRQQAEEALREAAEQLREVADSRPVHVHDADAWRGYLSTVVAELKAGPSGARPAPDASAGDGGNTVAPAPAPVSSGSEQPAAPAAPDTEPDSDAGPVVVPDPDPATAAGASSPPAPVTPPAGSGTLL